MTVAEGNVQSTLLDRVGRLQWGRNLTVAEGVKAYQARQLAGPLQWGRNLTVAEGGTRAGPRAGAYRFNGAAT